MTMSADFKSLLVRDEESASAVQFDLSTAAVADAWGLWGWQQLLQSRICDGRYLMYHHI